MTAAATPELRRAVPTGLLAAVFAVGVGTAVAHLHYRSMPRVVPAVIALALLAVGVWRGGWRPLLARAGWRAPALFAATLLLVAAPVLATPAARPQTAGWVVLALLGWGAALCLPLDDDAAAPRVASAPASWVMPALLALAVALIVTFRGVLHGGEAHIIDESLYLIQSRLFGSPGFARPVDAELWPFVATQQSRLGPHGFVTQYTPGWPAVLAAFRAVGLQRWVNVVLGFAGVLLTYRLGRRIHSPFAGAVAAGLLTTQMWVVSWFGTYFPHAAALCSVVAAALLLLRAEEAGRAGQWAQRALAGLLLGVCVTIRPVTGGALALSLFAWILLRRRRPFAEVATLGAAMAAGSVLPFAALALWNLHTNGSPLALGYSATNGTLHGLGFGMRGWIVYDADGLPMASADNRTFTPLLAVTGFARLMGELAAQTLPGALLLPLLAVGLRYGYRVPRAAAAFLVLPAAQFFHFSPRVRFYIELLPFAFVGVALLLAHCRARSPRVGAALVACLLLGNLAALAAVLRGELDAVQPKKQLARQLHAAQARHGRVLVLVPDSRSHAVWFRALYSHNVERFGGDVFVARDLGEDRTARLLQRFPTHAPYRLVLDAARRAVTLEPLGGAGPAASPDPPR